MLKNVHTPPRNIFICDKSEQSVGSTYLREMFWALFNPWNFVRSTRDL